MLLNVFVQSLYFKKKISNVIFNKKIIFIFQLNNYLKLLISKIFIINLNKFILKSTQSFLTV